MFKFTARCQISDESKDEESQEKVKTEKKSNNTEKTASSLGSLNSNYRESSSSGSEDDRVRPECRWNIFTCNDIKKFNHFSLHSSQLSSPMLLEDLEKFALRPAPRDTTIQCRVTRDRRGMEKGIYPTYYLHLEKEDGKRVSIAVKPLTYQSIYRSGFSSCHVSIKTLYFHFFYLFHPKRCFWWRAEKERSAKPPTISSRLTQQN